MRANKIPAIEPSATYKSSQNESRGNQEKYPSAHQKSGRGSAIHQDLHSILQSKDVVDMLQNPIIPSHDISGRPFSYPATKNFIRRLFSTNQDVPSVYRYLSLSNVNLNQHLYSQYCEKVHICVIGLPETEKEKLIRTFARDDNIRISQDKPLKFVVREEMVSFGTTLKIDIWSAEDSTAAVQDLRSLCGSSKTAIILVYKARQRYTLLIVEEWIKLLKHELSDKAPIILVSNKNGIGMSLSSKELGDDGMRVKKDNDLAAFYQCSTECVQEVEEVFLFAILKAFRQKIKTSISGTMSS
ncbi:hypothetical protein HNY73_007468 [Argiope bruennichi]|uniref:Uncharacterized protein n=1 Tax=Argiope bruennichi TaxID=94029 RepID=A0A8T0FE14_ARGBR|nr:hypothetical protein HNY73_007468 [Argiope bruennichi]